MKRTAPPLRSRSDTPMDIERRRLNEIREKYEQSKVPSRAALPPGERVTVAVAAPGTERGPSQGLPSTRCKLCPVASSYPRLCGRCTEVP